MGTDGLFDNLSPEEILMILNAEYEIEQKINIPLIARNIALFSYDISMGRYRGSFFARSAKAMGYNL